MKIRILLIVIICFSTLLHAQIQPTAEGSISGKVVDKNSKSPISYVNIVLKQENKVITGTITQDNGTFNIKNIALGIYTIEIQFIGYKNQNRSITLTNADKSNNLGTILLEEDAIQLEGVDVVKEKSTFEQKIDRKVINIGKDLITSGATAGEIMNNIPSVTVDPQTNAISLRGNSNVRILVDGKPSNMSSEQLLQQIPSASIKQVELITNPSAKYNPEGMSGIINIVLHKNSKIGFNGSINNGVTFGKTPKLNSALDMNYRDGKFNMYGNYGLNVGKHANNGNINNQNPGRINKQFFNFGDNNKSHLFKVGFDFYINDANTLSFYTTQNIFRGTGFGSNAVIYDDNTIGDVNQLFDTNNKNYGQTYNLDYKLKFKKEGHFVELEVNHNKNDNAENAVYSFPLNGSSFSNQIGTIGKNTIVNIDYENPLNKTTKLEFGLESRNDETNNNFDLNASYNSDFSYKRNIYSAYTTYGKQWKKWSAQAGFRLEQLNVDGVFKKADTFDSNNNGDFTEIISEKISDKRVSIYPSVNLTFNSTENNAFSFNYSRRVDRPSIQQVNPIREWSTPIVDSKGNPSLTPQFTNSYEFNYTRKTKIGSITSGIFYRQINNEITRVVYSNPDDATKQILSYANFADNDAYGFEVSGNLDFRKWWSANISIDIYNKKVKGIVESSANNYEFLVIEATNFNTRINNTFKATKNLRFQLFGMYRGRDASLQFTTKPMWKIDFGTSYTFLKGNATLSARLNDVFKTMNFSFAGDKPYPSNGQFNWESRTVYIGLNYKFGTGKNNALQRKQRDNNETQKSGGL